MAVGLIIDTREFSDALKRYMPHTERDLAEVINQKSFSINVAAAKITHKASAALIKEHLDERVQTQRTSKKGKVYTSNPPRAALLINSARAKEGLPGLYGSEMADAIAALKKKRGSHVAFLGSAWLPAVAAFARAIGKAVGANTSRWAEKAGIGDGLAARPGRNPASQFWNAAIDFAPSSSRPREAQVFAEDGMRRAITQECARMDEHVAKKLQATADKFAARFVR